MTKRCGERPLPGERRCTLTVARRTILALGMYEDDLDKRKWMRTQRSYGPDWDAAIEYGIDVSVLERNLSLTFEERLMEFEAQLRLIEALQPEGKPRGAPSTP